MSVFSRILSFGSFSFASWCLRSTFKLLSISPTLPPTSLLLPGSHHRSSFRTSWRRSARRRGNTRRPSHRRSSRWLEASTADHHHGHGYFTTILAFGCLSVLYVLHICLLPQPVQYGRGLPSLQEKLQNCHRRWKALTYEHNIVTWVPIMVLIPSTNAVNIWDHILS